MLPRIRSLFWPAACALVVLLPPPPTAHACGGFFCSNTSQPISQAGEKILFSVESDGSVTAVVQITYSGTAESFAWIVPVPSLPEISTGTNALFQQLDLETAPSFVVDDPFYPETVGSCRTPVCHDREGYSSSGGGCGYGVGSGVAPPPRPDMSFDGGLADAARSDGGAPVEVLGTADVGPYETVTLTGTDTTAIHDWLTAHGYLFPDSATAALTPYVAAGDDFVVLRLRKDAAVGDLVPLVMHYVAGEPCIPLQLTAIAALEDMPVTAFFLADGDVAPSNAYLATEVPEGSMLWVGSGDWYGYALSNAVDDAGGHAFVTEYAGLVPAVSLDSPSVADLASQHDVRAFLSALVARGYRGNAQLQALLVAAIPPPAGVDARTFFNCLTNSTCHDYDAYVATIAFDPAALSASIEAAFHTPAAAAQAMLARHSRLTRLATTISPAEMTVDPTFAVRPASRDVSNVHVAHVIAECSSTYAVEGAPLTLITESGARMPYRAGTPYPGDEVWCPDHGLIAGAGTARPMSTHSGLCGVDAGAAPLAAPFAVAVAAALLVVRRARKRRGAH